MAEPVTVQKAPFGVDVTADEEYRWCACGRSAKQPYCDGSHKDPDNGFKSLRFTATETKRVFLCGCKKSGTAPFCDGTHNKL